MNQAGIANIVVSLAVLAWILYRQLSTRPLREQSRIALILIVVGAAEAVPIMNHNPPSLHDAGFLLLSALIGIALAAVRALTVRIWADGDRVLRRGTIPTALLWLASIAQHLAVGFFVADGLGNATLLVYFGLVLAAQRQVLMIRARSQGLFAQPV